MNILYAFNPRTCSLTVAKFVLEKFEAEISSVHAKSILATKAALATLDVITQRGTGTAEDFQLLVAAGSAEGNDHAMELSLLDEESQFRAALPPAIKAQL